MPKSSKFPRLRTLVRKGAGGQRWVYYAYDMRPEGKKDVQLGKDYAAAIARWHELHNDRPAKVGRIQQAVDQWRELVLDAPDTPYKNPNTRRDYSRHLKRIEEWAGQAAWHEITVPAMRQYLRERKGKVQANRELAVLSIVWNYARKEGMTDLPWPAAGLERSGWKNREKARTLEVTDEMFAAIYAQGDQVLRDAMDIASATGMRVTDVRTVPMPPADGALRLEASKTGKRMEFVIPADSVLAELVKRRRANKRAMHLKLLTTPTGREVTYRMLADRFTDARELAVQAARKARQSDLADAIAVMVLRDCRRYAANLTETLEEARQLLQHGSAVTTAAHYRTRGDKGTLVR